MEFVTEPGSETQSVVCGDEKNPDLDVCSVWSHGWTSESEAYLGGHLENLISSAERALTPREGILSSSSLKIN